MGKAMHIICSLTQCLYVITASAGFSASNRSELVGHWQSVEFEGGVNRATNVDFYIYELVNLETNIHALSAPQEIDGQFWVNKSDGQKEALPWSVPIIRLNDMVIIGPSNDRYSCAFNRSNSVITLEDLKGHQFRRAWLKRVSQDPGPRRELPEALALRKQLHERFVGIWMAREWSCEMADFLSATNVTFTIYRIGRVFPESESKTISAYIECEFRENGSRRRLATGVTTWPMLEGGRLRFGMSPDGFIVNIALEGDLLVLQRKEGREHLDAKFERITRYPEERERRGGDEFHLH